MNRERMCAVCRTMKKRSLLFRVAKNSDGIFVDVDNKIQGRGAYICKVGDCAVQAQKRRALERSLSSVVEQSVYDILEELAKNAR